MFDEMNIPDSAFNDWRFQAYYDNGLWDFDNAFTREERFAIQESMREYLRDEYGIDFDAVFDWEDYRELYG